MKKFKMDISSEGSEYLSIAKVFGDEPTFTNDFLTDVKEFSKILKAIGRNDEIEEPIEFQIRTSDGKALDNMATLKNGDRIALEAQVGTSNMEHIAKLPYYMENLREEGDTMIGILMAEEFTQEAIDYYTMLNDQVSYWDLYLVKAVFIKMNDVVGFFPQLIIPTPTTNYLKSFKNKVGSAREKHSKATARPIPKIVTINGIPLKYNTWVDIHRNTFKTLIDAGKITEENCPHLASPGNPKSCVISLSKERPDGIPLGHTFEYKSMFINDHGSSWTQIKKTEYLIDTFGGEDYKLVIEE